MERVAVTSGERVLGRTKSANGLLIRSGGASELQKLANWDRFRPAK